ncbi:MAG: cephalosporin-C deacetylase-like acetyl esterase [Phycisphaerales bacterium]|jgi:cephalosporin-C deacetylase-like acetyl esterase
MLRVSSTLMPFALLATVAVGQPEQQDITFESEGESLVGTLYFPEGDQDPLGVLVLGHGSDPSTRESGQFYLTKALELGFAAFSYDKRGCGESGGEFVSFSVGTSEENFELLANDMASAFEAVKSIEDINNDLIGFMGGS